MQSLAETLLFQHRVPVGCDGVCYLTLTLTVVTTVPVDAKPVSVKQPSASLK